MERLQVAKIIREQLYALDRMAMWAYGAHQFNGYDAGEVFNGKTDLGGLMFHVKGLKLKRGMIQIRLNGNDLYTVEAYRKTSKLTQVGERKKRIPELQRVAEVDDVYAEDLIGVLDSIIEGK